jgi:thymidine kinase
MNGRIEVIAGCMFSGKAEELIRRLRRAMIAKQKVVVFKPVIDNRYEVEKIASHDGVMLEALPVGGPKPVFSGAQHADVVGIDEAQFFRQDIVDVAKMLASQGRRVVIAGLDLDYQGMPFGPMPMLLAVAERVDKLTAICTVCGQEAPRSQRIAASGEQVLVGGDDAYEARCREHWSPEPQLQTVYNRRGGNTGGT